MAAGVSGGTVRWQVFYSRHCRCPPGHEKVKDGTSSADAECKKTWRALIIGGVSATVLSLAVLGLAIAAAIVIRRKRSRKGIKVRTVVISQYSGPTLHYIKYY